MWGINAVEFTTNSSLNSWKLGLSAEPLKIVLFKCGRKRVSHKREVPTRDMYFDNIILRNMFNASMTSNSLRVNIIKKK